MRCSFCNSSVEESWKFCSFCGFELKRSNFSSVRKVLGDDWFKAVDDMLKYIINNSDDLFNGLNKTITLKLDENLKPVLESPEHEELVKSSGSVIEPVTNIKASGSNIFVEVNLPFVECVDDVEISLMLESIEVRARGGEMVYFKMIKTGRQVNILNKDLRDGKLFLELG